MNAVLFLQILVELSQKASGAVVGLRGDGGAVAKSHRPARQQVSVDKMVKLHMNMRNMAEQPVSVEGGAE